MLPGPPDLADLLTHCELTTYVGLDVYGADLSGGLTGTVIGATIGLVALWMAAAFLFWRRQKRKEKLE
ncbi:hypothetical protein PAPYR_2961 [Paratrimastix pyriformis]|uniref:Uncharacterized protein n=1 Tax=Paratrimastix pyriformis TaxID=342808 RepID=A0ABQ8UR00_9EUKA|nr:hypothetical protein PAPYR_2961 [Paratrimastix pyriformis]